MCTDIEAPDYTALADATRDSQDAMVGLGQQQLDFSRQQYNEMKPTFDRISQAQLSSMEQQQAQAKDYYDYQVNTFRPMEQQMVADAQNFNTEAYRNQLAARAAADAGLAFGRTNDANLRAMRSMGVNPNSGAAMAMQSQAGLSMAANRAGMMNNTRDQARELGWAKQMDAVGMGRNLAANATNSYNSAMNAGNSAGTNAAMPGQQHMQGMGMAASTMGQGYGLGMQGHGLALNAQNAHNQAKLQNTANGLDFAGGLLGAGVGLYTSDRRLKENIKFVSVDERTGLNLYEYNYLGTTRRYIGVMADEVEQRFPDAVYEDRHGFKGVDYQQLGLELKEVA